MSRRLNQHLQEDVRYEVDLLPCDATRTFTGVIKLRHRTQIDRLLVTSQAGHTGHSSNHWTIALKNSSNSNALMASYTTDSDVSGQGTLTSNVPKAGALGSAADIVGAVDDVLDVVVTKAASATGLASLTLVIEGRVF